ncbi:hypothetical protein P3T23_006247 [Paraburkholderia sp. GAS448]|uniref:DUF2917 domain-containing protein n=1 Tax=Paraburkholderia sp. GAS448 TaxID=3035136 RepID=UPI003D195129
MDRASQQSVCPDLTGCDSREANRLPRRVIHFALMPGRTVSLRLDADSEIRVRATRVWLTRVFSPYDYWVQPGDVIRLQRGERIWLSPDGDEVAEVTLTSEYIERYNAVSRWISRWAERLFDLSVPRSR